MEEPTLRTLLGQRDLRLRLISDQRMLPAGALEHPLRWVHSSDLADPTPFLADDLVLLTTGSQFADDDATGAAAYVSRLHDRGVRGLGFGTDVHRAGVPAELVEACAEAALPCSRFPT
ncbi:PucR family transcriptional regulator ligand-binding domain-containing protein [Microbacterium suwonense]|uniref:Purine catabolism PurC-like domain-containing protein n=1 Tax=Microbacterium suwonense TaxID=683047 RepID=A0ABM8FYC3_9MICO|nr:PucR family transcriptional regulator ligand-binding domain-containing protein [Microbacterium suwonense]BDZ40656.1 hypothetical protein GCM10025863_32700 [Microbacterium suwonense]